ncbi:hypothetical protein HY11_01615 [Hyphomonas pacifica]|nr:hypothetical protein HY11_01615 [Hyphomonas pacifica]
MFLPLSNSTAYWKRQLGGGQELTDQELQSVDAVFVEDVPNGDFV